MKIRGCLPVARQTSHVIAPKDAPARKSRPSRAIPWPAASATPRTIAPPATTTFSWRSSRPAWPARHGGQVDPRGQGQPQGLLRPDQGRRGVSAESAYRALLPRQYRQPRRNPHPQAAAASRGSSQATLQDADQGPYAHPHPALLPQRAGEVRAGRGQGQAGLGQARDREAPRGRPRGTAAINANKHRGGR